MDPIEDEFKDHYTLMPWMTLPFEDKRIETLKEDFNITQIPQLTVLDAKTGYLITHKGRKDIHEQGQKCIKDWSKLLVINKEKDEKRKNEEEKLKEQNEQNLLKMQQIIQDSKIV